MSELETRNKFVKCPYCNNNVDIWAYYANMCHGEVEKVSCDCGKSFEITYKIKTWIEVKKNTAMCDKALMSEKAE